MNDMDGYKVFNLEDDHTEDLQAMTERILNILEDRHRHKCADIAADIAIKYNTEHGEDDATVED